ncbi:hypothetical protein [uncultured Clostridium sp.]|nr:hypothetical protein [uncultured Clostridium sp.]
MAIIYREVYPELQFILINIIRYGLCFMFYEIYRRIRRLKYSS